MSTYTRFARTPEHDAALLLEQLLAALPDDDQTLEAIALEFARRKAMRDALGKHPIDAMCQLALTRLSGLVGAIDEVGTRWQDQRFDYQDSLSSESAGGGAGSKVSRPYPSSTLPPALADHALRYAERERDARAIDGVLIGRHRTLKVPQDEHDELMEERDAQWLRERQGRQTPLVILGQGDSANRIEVQA